MEKAIICADGLFREFVPLSLEKPKPLWPVRGEKPVERLILQAKESGITDITVVVGYKKEQFEYLKDAFGVSLSENVDFRNVSGRDALKGDTANAVVTCAGMYYEANPFLSEDNNVYDSGVSLTSFDDLRKFDSSYITKSGSNIIRNIKLVFHCDEEDISDFEYLDRQQTNASFTFKIAGVKYIYRYPAEGIEESVSWKNEKSSMVIAKKLGIDTTYIYADIHEGWKIMEFIGPHAKPDYASFEDSKKIIGVLRALHSAPVRTDYGMKPWEEAESMIESLNKINPNTSDILAPLREKIHKIYEKTLNDGVEKCFCHGDVYRPNWMMMPDGSVILIDWEYAGYSDPGIDIGYYIADAGYDMDEAKRFIREYLGDDYTDKKLFHFLAYTALIAYYWYVWALLRRAKGEPRDDIESNYGKAAQKYAKELSE